MTNSSDRRTAGPRPVVHDPRDPAGGTHQRSAPRAGDVRTGVMPSDPQTGGLSSGTSAAPQTAIGAERPPEAQESRGSRARDRDPLVQPSAAMTGAMQQDPAQRRSTPLRFGLVIVALVVLVLVAALAL